MGICCLGRNIEIKDLKFSVFERRKNREVDELEVTLERAKAENGNKNQLVIINDPLFLSIYDEYIGCFNEEQKATYKRVFISSLSSSISSSSISSYLSDEIIVNMKEMFTII